MLIPSIDIMQGRAVQLRQGRECLLTSERDPLELASEFNRYGPVAVIDLDAAMGSGDNLELVCRICRVAEVRAGGGIRDEKRARQLLRSGAARLIIGTAANEELLGSLPRERLMLALDHRQGTVQDSGWQRSTGEGIRERAQRLAQYCSSLLVTNIEVEGSQCGVDEAALAALAEDLPLPVTVAGGVASADEVASLSARGIDVQVGMSLYSGMLDPVQAVLASLAWPEAGLLPTVVQDESGQLLMQAWSSRESLAQALRSGRGSYWSRSRRELWVKGSGSGNTQQLLSVRTDCDRDSLQFVVRQSGPACHKGSRSCFGYQRAGLEQLFETLRQRRAELPEGSLSTRMFSDPELLRRKIMEEAFELATADDPVDLRWEIADLLYFASLKAVAAGIDWKDIEAELAGRMK